MWLNDLRDWVPGVGKVPGKSNDQVSGKGLVGPK